MMQMMCRPNLLKSETPTAVKEILWFTLPQLPAHRQYSNILQFYVQ